MTRVKIAAADLHKNVPKNWYFESIRIDPFQKFWHLKRFNAVSNIIDPVEGEILDVGCNDGTFTKVILDKSGAKRIVGADVVEKAVEWANTHWRRTGKMKFVLADAASLPFPSRSFDAVFALEVLEHVFDPKKVLLGIKRVLKKGGYAVFLVPSDNWLFKIVWYLWLHFYPRGKIWKETHIQTYKGNFLPRISRRVGFKITVDRKIMLGMLHLVKVKK